MNPIRIQRSRKVKQVSPNGLPIVYVGRPTKYGNLYRVDDPDIVTTEKAVKCFEVWIKYLIESRKGYLEQIKKDLKGKNLSCWCKIGEPCHADILLKIANKQP